MTHPIRSIPALSILVIVLVACGTGIGAPATQAPSPSEPTAPSVEPSVALTESPSPGNEEREVAGTITVAEMAFSGPGGTIQEALDNGPSGDLPTLVNGVLFRDSDGTVYLASSISDTTAPAFDGPMLEVLNIERDGDGWDMANAERLGLEEANGIVFEQGAQVLGFLTIP